LKQGAGDSLKFKINVVMSVLITFSFVSLASTKSDEVKMAASNGFETWMEACVQRCLARGLMGRRNCEIGCATGRFTPMAAACKQKLTDQPNACSLEKISQFLKTLEPKQSAESQPGGVVN
jgi:hypothetical protein